ncbi:hypothetical protein [Acinetobacter equi]|uniref:Uncharacterized protein n=1 Tax=Acinetobacter equi TaxID=1324350 RepID=A0A0N9W339_9GAMM|nr:hypothetical protein [Acinetobacter equi]ALH96056.1 hypothetical protein AOY20_11220 [Acinetobacter equi]
MQPLPMIAPVTHDQVISYEDFIKSTVTDLEYVEIFPLLKSKFHDLLNEDIISFKINKMQNVKVFYLHADNEILIKSFNLNIMDDIEIYEKFDDKNKHLNLFSEIFIQESYPLNWQNEMYPYDIFDAFDDKQQFQINVSDIDSIKYFVETFEANIPYWVIDQLNLFKNTTIMSDLIQFSQKIHNDFLELKDNYCSLTTIEILKSETEKFAEHIAKTAEKKLVKNILDEIYCENSQKSGLKNILSGSDLFDSDMGSNQYVKDYIFNKVKTHFENIETVERKAILYMDLGSEWLDELDYECPIGSISDFIDEDDTLNKISRNILKHLMINR